MYRLDYCNNFHNHVPRILQKKSFDREKYLINFQSTLFSKLSSNDLFHTNSVNDGMDNRLVLSCILADSKKPQDDRINYSDDHDDYFS